ncbi:MAG TPA: dihydrodipicolinate synthase family protein, partial [Bryobacteraceae bacterium]
QHYRAIAASIKIPVVVYSVQGRTGVNVEPATLARLAAIDNIAGVKEASGNINQIGAVIHQVPENFLVLSGDDSMTLPLMALGGKGIISVAANQIPAEMTELAKLCLRGDFAAARAMHHRYLALMDVNFIESNPIPVKSAMGLMGLLDPVFRLPMCPPKPENLKRIQSVLESAGLLHAVGSAKLAS